MGNDNDGHVGDRLDCNAATLQVIDASTLADVLFVTRGESSQASKELPCRINTRDIVCFAVADGLIDGLL